MSEDKIVKKAYKMFRQMTTYQRIQVRDWLNSWYDYVQEQEMQELQEEQELKDECTCYQGETNIHCRWCF